MTCPRCGCPAYRRTGAYYTWTHDYDADNETFVDPPTGRCARCMNCDLFQQRLPGKGIVGTYPRGPFNEEGSA